jgi:hypothetical protein
MAFRLDSLLISLIIFSFIIAAGSGWITSMAEKYEVPYDKQFGTVYSTVKATENLTKEQKELVIGGDIEEDDALDSAIKGATSAVKLMTAPIEIVTLITKDVQGEIAAGGETDVEVLDVSMYIKVALTISIIFGLIYLVFRIRSW